MGTSYDSVSGTLRHIESVRRNLLDVISNLFDRAEDHDASKLTQPEKSWLDDLGSQNPSPASYGSKEYDSIRNRNTGALRHHYLHNDHHPEHYEGGIAEMSLMALMEMLADWRAATERHVDGDIRKSLDHNLQRFGIGPQLGQILLKTIEELNW